MSANKPAWTAPGSIDPAGTESAEARKGTAASNPVLSLAPAPPAGAGRGEPADGRSPAEIEAAITQTRDRLAGTLDELSERLSPRAALRRANSAARGAFVSSDGAVRKGRTAIVAGSLAAAVGGFVTWRVMRRR